MLTTLTFPLYKKPVGISMNGGEKFEFESNPSPFPMEKQDGGDRPAGFKV